MQRVDKNIIRLGFVSYFTDMASAMVNPILPIFVVVVLHEGMDKLGFIIAIATFVSYAIRFISGYISDRYNIVKPLVVVGYGISAITKPLIGFTHSYVGVTALKSFERFGKGVRSAPKDLMIASFSKKNESGKTFGIHKTLDIAGELSGTIILFLLLHYFGSSEEIIRNIFLATLIPGVIGVLIMLFLVRDIEKPKNFTPTSFKLTTQDIGVIKNLSFYFLFLFFMFNEAFFTMQAKEQGIATALIPLLFIVSTTTQTLTSYTIGVWVDKVGREKIMLLAYFSGVISQFLLYIQDSIFTWIAYAFLGLFTVASLNANRSYIAESSDNRGSVYGIFYAAFALFSALGAYVWGYVWENFGIERALLYSLLGTLIIILIYMYKALKKI